MAENSAIEWCDHTFNPWEGCQKVGPGCDHCYAETRNARFGGGIAPNWGPAAPRRLTSDSNWHKPLGWQAQAAVFFATHGRRQRIFCASLADWADNAVPDAWRARLADRIRATPDLDWLLLTKRIGNAPVMLRSMFPDGVPPNVQLGITVVNQAELDRDVPRAIAVKNALGVRRLFLSIEPMLGPIRFAGARAEWLLHIDQIIVGGESGPRARPMHPDWARGVRDDCAAAGVPFLFKQWGEYAPVYDRDIEDPDWRRCAEVLRKFPRGRWLNLAGGHGFHGERVVYVDRPGKKAAGRLLDGVEHNGFPLEAR